MELRLALRQPLRLPARLSNVMRALGRGLDLLAAAGEGRPAAVQPSVVAPDQLAPRAALHGPAPSRDGAAVRLGIIGSAPPWFEGWARTVQLDPDWGGSWPAVLGAPVDALLVDGGRLATAPDGVCRAAVAARRLGAAVISFVDAPDEVGGPVDLEIDDGRARLPRPTTVRRALIPPVDVRAVNPGGFRPRPEAPVALVVDLPPEHRGWDTVRARARNLDGEVEVHARPGTFVDVPGARVRRRGSAPNRMIERLRRCAGVVDDPAFHADAGAHATRLAQLACAGVVVVAGELPRQVRELLGPRVVAELGRIGPEMLRDAHALEGASVRLRRAGLATHSTTARWQEIAGLVGLPVRRPAVSAVMSTNRPDRIPAAAAQLARQDYTELEVIVVVHGDSVPGAQRRKIQGLLPVPVQFREVDATATLGDALNAGCEVAAGDLITKVDDDDWYASTHVSDLVVAIAYSEAQLVGKGAEFVYLGPLDATIRRFAGRGEKVDRNLAGGTLMLRRDDLRSLGGWRRVRRAVDQRLIDDVVGSGGVPYRTHGFGFVLNRHGQGHTWTLDADYFLRQASSQRPGLDLAFAGVDAPADAGIPSAPSLAAQRVVEHPARAQESVA